MSDEQLPEPERSPAPAPPAAPARGISRRALLLGGGGLGLGVVATAVAVSTANTPSAEPGPTAAPVPVGSPVPAHGAQQAGIARPATPQRNGLIVVADLEADRDPDAATVLAALAAAGDAIDACTDPERYDRVVLPDGPGDVTVTIGLGPRLVRTIDPALPGAEELPAFRSDDGLTAEATGGDLLIAVYAGDAGALHPVADHVLAAIPGARRRWAQQAVRGAGTGTVVRNPLGYHDGIIVPHTEDELAAGVWIGSGPAAGGTVAVIRRLRLDVAGFGALAPAAQDAVIGRERASGAPLSGGSRDDQVDLGAKTPEGEYLIPVRAHARAAHPSFTASPLMLRRGYAFSNAGPERDDGLLFMCFQNDLQTFVRTQHRLDETDDLMAFTRATASASFLIPPGREDGAPLGASLAGGRGSDS
ncbi:Dyp-type peroxidase [Microbacterium sp. HD4P20]|uniref:Dyp-type peroxidase n=1 Tax=Microbacterium sp. HD4P20 TaxID=2864874 RepID=UPI001C63C611|nr:Dyp-type peroxidase [Microbacterium sp. HD4P20]MCP2638128.1 Dyp-type peroxidase [Microbacterium sp. HD4P20]